MEYSSILTFLYLLIGSVLFVCVYVVKRSLTYWEDRNVPHDPPKLFYGNLKGAGRTHHMLYNVREVYKHHKGKTPFAGFYLYMKPSILALDLDLIKAVLIKDFNNFTSRGLFVNPRDDPLTGHLFALDGKKWRELRHKLSPTFTSGKMKFMYPTVTEVANRFGETFDKFVAKDSIVEIKELLARFTTDVIGTCAFGIDCNSLKDPNAEFRIMGQRIFTHRRNGIIVGSFIRMCPDLAKRLGLKILCDDTTNFFMKVVKETVEYREKNNVQRNDFINMLIELKNNKVTYNEEGEEISGLTMNELAAQVFVFFVAGFETSSTAMGFCLHELAQNHSIQDKLRGEINSVIADAEGEFTYECMKRMTYLDQVINETLRKYAVVPILTRKAINDYKIPNGNFIIKKNTLVLIPADAIHRDPDIFPEPDKFDPERFATEEIAKRHPCAWLPFGDGPRNCIGMRFGRMQARIGLVELLRKFKFSVSAKTEMSPKMSPIGNIIVGTLNGIYLKVERV